MTEIFLLSCLALARFSYADEVSCGMLANRQFSVGQEYLYFTPELVGDSWTPQRPAVRSCEQEWKTLRLEVLYPSMQADGGRTFQNSKNLSHVSITITKVADGVDKDLSGLLSYYLRKANGVVEKWDDSLKAQSYIGVDPSYGKGLTEVYWEGGDKAPVTRVIRCTYLNRKPSSKCELSYLGPSYSALVSILFSYDSLPNWRSILEQSNELINKLSK